MNTAVDNNTFYIGDPHLGLDCTTFEKHCSSPTPQSSAVAVADFFRTGNVKKCAFLYRLPFYNSRHFDRGQTRKVDAITDYCYQGPHVNFHIDVSKCQ